MVKKRQRYEIRRIILRIRGMGNRPTGFYARRPFPRKKTISLFLQIVLQQWWNSTSRFHESVLNPSINSHTTVK
ncbi:MAG: hypothetical protein C4527_15435 [Candidatus Omnitrophota bacterium]|nr:MAG: hypothetical protein C4527_15435 [Candidatus Omnitrophota bacterium]